MYAMSRDRELPEILQKLNSFGSPWIAAVVAAGVPAIVLLFAHDLETLASLYAIGVVGAIAINITLCAFHPRLRRWWRKVPMFLMGMLLVGIEITLASTKRHALYFALTVMIIGLILRQITRTAAKRRPKPSLLRQAVVEQLPADAMLRPKVLMATAGSALNAIPSLAEAKRMNASLVVCFIRDVALSYKVRAEERFSLDTDRAAQLLFRDFLALGHDMGVPIIPAYDTGDSAPELIAEIAALYGVEKILIGSSRRSALHHLIKGNFQRQLEDLLPPEIPVEVLAPEPASAGLTVA